MSLHKLAGSDDFGIISNRAIFRKLLILLYDRAMRMPVQILHSPLVNISVGFLLSIIWVIFAWSHVQAWQATGIFALLVFCLSESLQALFFLFRRVPKTVSIDPFDWLVAGGGSFAPLLFRPGGEVLFEHGDKILLIGVFLQIAGLLSLNRSFAIVAAKRSVKTRGMYSIVRHPMYASYIFLFLGYILFNFSIINLFLVMMSFLFMYLRIEQEEKHLLNDPTYLAFTKKTKWRLVPFVY